MSSIIKPASIRPGDTIGVMAPSSYIDQKDILNAKDYLNKKGYNVILHPQFDLRHNQSAGTHEQKIEALYDLFIDKNIKAIFAAGGGNRALHLLEKINFQVIQQNPKLLMGFSDVTALLNSFYAKANLVTIHGPVLTWLPKMEAMFDFNMGLLSGDTPSYPMNHARVLKTGKAMGPLVGGNLSIFHLMTGTSYCPDLKGSILFLEDLKEEISKLDRMLLHLRHTGALAKISGIICGGFTEILDCAKPYGFELDELILEHTQDYNIPIIMDAPFGHGDQLYAFPIGVKAKLNASSSSIELTLIESAVI